MRIVIGIHACREALRVRPRAVTRLSVRQDWEKNSELTSLVSEAKRKKVRFETVGDRFLQKWGEGHQGIALEVSEDPQLDWGSLRGDAEQMLLALDGITDPHNLGAMARTAWLLGASGILLPKSRSASVTPIVSKVASGALEHIPVETHGSLVGPLTTLKEKGFWIFGLSEKGSKSIWDLDLKKTSVVWAIGAEGSGLKSQTLKFCDEQVSIPQTDNDASMNASVAAALAMAETRRQWGH